MSLTLLQCRLWQTALTTRLPFKYGIATLTDLPHVVLELELADDDHRTRGLSADHLPPKWFTKDPHRPIPEEIDEMVHVIETAAHLATGLQAEDPFTAWFALHEKMEAWRRTAAVPPLLAHFGTSLVERALIDAFCRGRGLRFSAALRSGALGVKLGQVHPELTGGDVRDLLPPAPASAVFVRHTIGLGDPLARADQAERIHDGLPETLEENIEAYQLQHFKIKFTGLEDLPRLAQTLAILRRAPGPLRFTLDGNESFRSVPHFQAVWQRIEQLPGWGTLRPHLLCVEQPFHRDVALDEDTGRALRDWSERPPLIIDESDAELDSVRRALAAGYVGTSHKNCKGVFRGIANACLLAARGGGRPSSPWLQTGEDLANVGPIALLQDLAVQATLGITSIERNGHHYFRGVSHLPDTLQARLLTDHGDVYRRHPQGFATLSIRAGQLSLASVLRAPFGVQPAWDPPAFAVPLASRGAPLFGR